MSQPGLTLSQLAQACDLSMSELVASNPELKHPLPASGLSPGTTIFLPTEAKCRNLRQWGTVKSQRVVGGVHRYDLPNELRKMLSRVPPTLKKLVVARGAPSFVQPSTCQPTHQTPAEYVESLMKHLGPTDENFFSSGAPPYKKGALLGVVMRLLEYLQGTDSGRVERISQAGYDAEWMESHDREKPVHDRPAGFITGYAWCAQSYIDGFHDITLSEAETRKYITMLVLRIEDAIRVNGLDLPHDAVFP